MSALGEPRDLAGGSLESCLQIRRSYRPDYYRKIQPASSAPRGRGHTTAWEAPPSRALQEGVGRDGSITCPQLLDTVIRAGL